MSTTRLSVRDVHAQRVYRAMLTYAEEIEHARDVLRLDALRGMNGEVIAVAVADLVAQGLVVGASGAGRIRAIEQDAQR